MQQQQDTASDANAHCSQHGLYTLPPFPEFHTLVFTPMISMEKSRLAWISGDVVSNGPSSCVTAMEKSSATPSNRSTAELGTPELGSLTGNTRSWRVGEGDEPSI